MLSRRHKRAIVGLAAFGLLTAIILFSISRFISGRALQRQLAEERASLRPPEPVIAPVVRETIERRRSFAARAEPWTRATVAPEVAGTVIRLSAEVGLAVATGAELLALDDRTARAVADAAAIQAAEAKRRHGELEQLAQTAVVAPSDLASAAAAAAAAAREADRAATLLEKQVLRAPFAGTVQARHADVGDYLNNGQPAFEIVDVARLRIVFQAGETEVGSFVPGAALEVSFPALGGQTAQATVRHVAPASGTNGSFRIEAELANPNGAIPGGMAAVVTTSVRLYRDTLFIPTAAVRLEGSRAIVLRQREGAPLEPVTVEIGPEIEGRFPVFAGLAEGDRLVIR